MSGGLVNHLSHFPSQFRPPTPISPDQSAESAGNRANWHADISCMMDHTYTYLAFFCATHYSFIALPQTIMIAFVSAADQVGALLTDAPSQV